MERDADVVVVGAGIGGAALALALARAGRTTVLLERTAAPPPPGRPEILWPATMAALDQLGIGPRVRSEGSTVVNVLDIRIRDDAAVTLSIGPEPAPERRVTDPSETRALLLAEAVKTGKVTVERGVDVRSIEMRPQDVLVEGWHAGIVVADDGVHSRVRQEAGIRVTLREFPAEFAGTILAGTLTPRGTGLVHLDPRAIRTGVFGALLLALPHDRTAVVCFLPRGVTPDGGIGPAAARLAASARDALAATPDKQFIRAIRPVGHAERYVGDRVALLGDAAHPMSPAGGQGANAAIADAMALAAVLVARLPQDDLTAAALGPYENARRAANERSVGISRRAIAAIRLLRAVPGATALVRPALSLAGRSERMQRRLLETFATAFVGEPVQMDG